MVEYVLMFAQNVAIFQKWTKFVLENIRFFLLYPYEKFWTHNPGSNFTREKIINLQILCFDI